MHSTKRSPLTQPRPALLQECHLGVLDSPALLLEPMAERSNLFDSGESYHPNKSGQSLGYLPLIRAVTG